VGPGRQYAKRILSCHVARRQNTHNNFGIMSEEWKYRKHSSIYIYIYITRIFSEARIEASIYTSYRAGREAPVYKLCEVKIEDCIHYITQERSSSLYIMRGKNGGLCLYIISGRKRGSCFTLFEVIMEDSYLYIILVTRLFSLDDILYGCDGIEYCIEYVLNPVALTIPRWRTFTFLRWVLL
jgi:hypothetical protein